MIVKIKSAYKIFDLPNHSLLLLRTYNHRHYPTFLGSMCGLNIIYYTDIFKNIIDVCTFVFFIDRDETDSDNQVTVFNLCDQKSDVMKRPVATPQ